MYDVTLCKVLRYIFFIGGRTRNQKMFQSLKFLMGLYYGYRDKGEKTFRLQYRFIPKKLKEKNSKKVFFGYLYRSRYLITGQRKCLKDLLPTILVLPTIKRILRCPRRTQSFSGPGIRKCFKHFFKSSNKVPGLVQIPKKNFFLIFISSISQGFSIGNANP